MQTDECQDAHPSLLPGSTLEEEMAHWHIEEAQWKVEQVSRMLARHHLTPRQICEVGSGSGDMLRQLQARMDPQCVFQGYELSSHAIDYSRQHENDRLHFSLRDVRAEATAHFDLLLLMDVLEHVEDYLDFLGGIRPKAEYKLFQVALNISAQTVLRKHGLLNIRLTYGMRNFFTRETLLQALKDTGYEIVDCFYTAPGTDLPTHVFRKKLMKIPRRLFFGLHPDLGVRLLGGYRLLVLAR